MTDPQFYILVAIPVVGVLVNAALLIHLSSTMNLRFASLEARLDSWFNRLDARFDRLDERFDKSMER